MLIKKIIVSLVVSLPDKILPSSSSFSPLLLLILLILLLLDRKSTPQNTRH